MQLCVFKLAQTLLIPNKGKAPFHKNKSLRPGVINLLHMNCDSYCHTHADITNQTPSSPRNQPQAQIPLRREYEPSL